MLELSYLFCFVISNLVRTTRFWINVLQIHSMSKDRKANNLKSFWEIGKQKCLSKIAKVD